MTISSSSSQNSFCDNNLALIRRIIFLVECVPDDFSQLKYLDKKESSRNFKLSWKEQRDLKNQHFLLHCDRSLPCICWPTFSCFYSFNFVLSRLRAFCIFVQTLDLLPFGAHNKIYILQAVDFYFSIVIVLKLGSGGCAMDYCFGGPWFES